jgi:ABC-type molybdenum transport system ATPase subunit/photorepair protein PhrA
MPDSARLSSLTISGLRGILQTLTLEFYKPMTLVYGENGTGKTSICDALDLLGNGKCGSLDDISVGHGKHQHWPHLGQRPTDISVNLNAVDGTAWSATVNGSRASIISNNGSDAPTIKIWRRKQLMDLILSTPADRFKVIEPFIDIRKIAQSESALRNLLETTNRNINTASIRVSESLETLRGQQELAGNESSDTLVWAREEIASSADDMDSEIGVLNVISRQTDTLVNVLEQVSELHSTVENNQGKLDEANTGLDAIRARSSSGNDDVLKILETAQLFFHDHRDSKVCPLCESEEKIDGLPDRIDQKLAEMAEIREANTAVENAQSELNQSSNGYQGAVARVDQLASGLLDKVVQSNLSDTSKALLSSLNSETIKCITVLTGVRDAIDQQRTVLMEQKGRRDSLRAALEQHDQNKQALQESGAILPKVERLIRIHENERKRFIDNILSGIADEVGRLYESIHPGEGLNNVALQLDPNRNKSLDIRSEFLGQQVQPGAYFSNSHLDSLGLCILIALAKMTEPENTILVLDDILGSIDEPHVDRVVKMLYEESQNFLHTLITTHYHAWHHKIRRGQLRNADCQVIELRTWRPGVGVSVQAAGRPLVEILRANIHDNPGEIEPIAANAGHLLEQLGDFLVTHYACSIPKRLNGNTLNEYLNSLRPGFVRHLRVEMLQPDSTYLELELEPVISELKDIYQVRNTTGAHYNELASHLPPSDVLRFGELVIQLADALICPENGFPNREKNGSYWATKGETRRLYPLQKP